MPQPHAFRVFPLLVLAVALAGCDKAADSGSSAIRNPSDTVPAAIDSSLLPTIHTSNVWKVSRIQASCQGDLMLHGGSQVTESGVCWSTRANPTIADSRAINNTGSATFELVMSGLVPGTTYHARAYATNSHGTSYGRDLEFATDSASSAPTCTPVENSTTINIGRQNYAWVSADTNGHEWGRYAIVGGSSSAELSAEFSKAPRTGLYETILPQGFDPQTDTTHLVLHGMIDNASVTAKPGSVVSVVKRGENQYSLTFCRTPFELVLSGHSATYVTDGNLTTNR